ncbi:hypothetical protein F750_3066 [Streptomyces sp. PAMC 26508]|nr:hypothetical protein F750_3066 [Streptomyces sp. PAMC 26508]
MGGGRDGHDLLLACCSSRCTAGWAVPPLRSRPPRRARSPPFHR